jgi:hypothetical protein
MNRLNSGNPRYHSIHNLSSSCLQEPKVQNTPNVVVHVDVSELRPLTGLLFIMDCDAV